MVQAARINTLSYYLYKYECINLVRFVVYKMGVPLEDRLKWKLGKGCVEMETSLLIFSHKTECYI